MGIAGPEYKVKQLITELKKHKIDASYIVSDSLPGWEIEFGYNENELNQYNVSYAVAGIDPSFDLIFPAGWEIADIHWDKINWVFQNTENVELVAKKLVHLKKEYKIKNYY